MPQLHLRLDMVYLFRTPAIRAWIDSGANYGDCASEDQISLVLAGLEASGRNRGKAFAFDDASSAAHNQATFET
jgi:hypothetical protein